MSGLTLREIREALAAQLSENISATHGITVAAYFTDAEPSLIIEAAPEYVTYWGTFGAAGIASANFVLALETGANDPVSRGIALDSFLSVGTGNEASVIDAVMAVRTLGLTGCAVQVLGCEVDPEEFTARIPITVYINKVGANA